MTDGVCCDCVTFGIVVFRSAKERSSPKALASGESRHRATFARGERLRLIAFSAFAVRKATLGCVRDPTYAALAGLFP